MLGKCLGANGRRTKPFLVALLHRSLSSSLCLLKYTRISFFLVSSLALSLTSPKPLSRLLRRGPSSLRLPPGLYSLQNPTQLSYLPADLSREMVPSSLTFTSLKQAAPTLSVCHIIINYVPQNLLQNHKPASFCCPQAHNEVDSMIPIFQMKKQPQRPSSTCTKLPSWD